jgi:L,D-peptidoglycan transpeptidase YkuD (ErfK/YbiS/YcfS/YnhG family)
MDLTTRSHHQEPCKSSAWVDVYPGEQGDRNQMRTRVLFIIVGLATGYAVILAGSALWAKADVLHQPCRADGLIVQIDTASRIMSLCRSGREEASFRVAVGRNGVDKRIEGDERTPRGRYSLSLARPSNRYHLFLAVGYPTGEQTKRGYTGGAIGLHGPHAAFTWLGHATVWPDWTLGCIAVSTRAEIEEVARWVNANRVTEIIIL